MQSSLDWPEQILLRLTLKTYFGQFQGVLKAARALGDIGIVGVVVTFTHDFDIAKPVQVVHVGLAFPLDVLAVPSAVVALHHLGIESALSRPTDAF